LGLAKLREQHKKGQSGGGATAETDLLPADGADGADSEEDENPRATKKIGAKKAAKLEAKEERRLEQEAIKKEREEAKEREQLRRDEEDKERAEAKALEKKKEEEEPLVAAEKKQKEQEEYEAMKSMFSVEEAGSVAETIQTESQGLLAEFVEYIKDTKVVLLEELATKFGLKTQDVIMRLKNLEEMGQITGVMDDRGKYIYISEDVSTPSPDLPWFTISPWSFVSHCLLVSSFYLKCILLDVHLVCLLALTLHASCLDSCWSVHHTRK
jgi:DDRGK domain-containing protein 1